MSVLYTLIRDMISSHCALWRIHVLTMHPSDKRKWWQVSGLSGKMSSVTLSSTAWKRIVTSSFREPDESENVRPRQFDLCSHIFPQEHLIFLAAVYSFDISDLSRLIKACSEVNSSLGEQVAIHLPGSKVSLSQKLLLRAKGLHGFVCYILAINKI